MVSQARVVVGRHARSRTLAVIDLYGDEPPPTTTEVVRDSSIATLMGLQRWGAYNYIELSEGLRVALRGRGLPFVSGSGIASVLRTHRTGTASVDRPNGYGFRGPAEWVWGPGPAEWARGPGTG